MNIYIHVCNPKCICITCILNCCGGKIFLSKSLFALYLPVRVCDYNFTVEFTFLCLGSRIFIF